MYLRLNLKLHRKVICMYHILFCFEINDFHFQFKSSSSSHKSSISTAKLSLLTATLRKTNEEAKALQSSYIDSLASARLAMKNEYKWLLNENKNKDLADDANTEQVKSFADVYFDLRPRKEEEPDTVSIINSQETTNEEKPTQEEQPPDSGSVIESQEASEPAPSKEDDITTEPENHTINEHAATDQIQQSDMKQDRISDKNEVCAKEKRTVKPSKDPNGDLIREIKDHAVARLDNKWRKDHPIYQEIKSGFKSQSKIHDTRQISIHLTRMRYAFSTENLPESSEYVKEAKRLYPQAFGLNRHQNRSKTSDSQFVAKSFSEVKLVKIEDAPTADLKVLASDNVPVNVSRPIKTQTRYNTKPAKPKTDEKQKHEKIVHLSSERVHFISGTLKTKSRTGTVEKDKLQKDRDFIDQYQKDSNHINNVYVSLTRNKHRGEQHYMTNKKGEPIFHFQSKGVLRGGYTRESSRSSHLIKQGLVRGNTDGAGPVDTCYETGQNTQSSGSLQSDRDSITAAVDIVKSRNRFYDNCINLSVGISLMFLFYFKYIW